MLDLVPAENQASRRRQAGVAFGVEAGQQQEIEVGGVPAVRGAYRRAARPVRPLVGGELQGSGRPGAACSPAPGVSADRPPRPRSCRCVPRSLRFSQRSSWPPACLRPSPALPGQASAESADRPSASSRRRGAFVRAPP
ncbi:hypothetical protein ACRAWF_16935 [Streptomyces sp. L7]